MAGIELGRLLAGIVDELAAAAEQGEHGGVLAARAGEQIRVTAIGVDLPASPRFRSPAWRPTLRLPSASGQEAPAGRLRLHLTRIDDRGTTSTEEDP